jgi:hypothetical protein
VNPRATQFVAAETKLTVNIVHYGRLTTVNGSRRELPGLDDQWAAQCYDAKETGAGAAMTQDQKIVAVGAVSGVAGMAVLVWLLSTLIPPPAIADTAADRLAYAVRWATLPALLFFAMVAAVGNARFTSEAIDPTLGKESPGMVVDGRVADNTLQQLVLFLVGMFGLAVTLPLYRLSIVAAVSITFVVVRLAFWIGYRIKPVYRAFGFSSTAYMNLGMLVATLWVWLAE